MKYVKIACDHINFDYESFAETFKMC